LSEPAPDASPRRLLWSAATNWLAFAAQLVVAFFLAPVVIRTLGDGPYGVWAFVESILAYFSLLDLGVASCLVSFVARHRANRAWEELNRVSSACLAVFCAGGLVAVLAGALTLPWCLPRLTAHLTGPAEAAWFVGLLLVNLALTLPLSVFPAILDGLQLYAVKSGVRVVLLGLRVAATLAVLWYWPGLVGIAAVHTACTLLEHVALAVVAFRRLPSLRFSPRLIDRATLRQVRGFSWYSFLALLAGRISFQTDALVIGSFWPEAFITYFALASRPVEFAKSLLRTVTTTLTPAVSSLEARGDVAALGRMLCQATRALLYLALPVHLGLLVFGRPFLSLWMGDPAYGDRCYPALATLAVPFSLVIALSVAARIFYGTGRLRLYARLALVEAGLNLGLSLALVRPYGITGVAVGTAVPSALVGVVAIAAVCRMVGVRGRDYLRSAVLKPVALAVPLAGFWLFAHEAVPVVSWLDFAGLLAAGCGLFALLVAGAEAQWRRLAVQFGRACLQRLAVSLR
jgi:O-antigen/teichoic acid export membrane protein